MTTSLAPGCLLALSTLLGACDRPPPVSPIPPLTTATSTAPLAPAAPPATEPLATPAAPAPAASPAGCDPASWKTALQSCEPFVARFTASASGNYWPAARAVDGDSCTAWNSGGFAPQAITLDLGEPRPVGRVVLVPEMTPDGAVAHVVEVSNDGVRFEVRGRYEGTMVERGVYGVALSPAALARYVRVRTERSPSWVAWNEIVPVACPGQHATAPAPQQAVATPAARPVPPPEPRASLVAGTGACTRDADCHPDAPCHAAACTSRPSPFGPVQCTKDCSGPMDCGRGGCVCDHGRCAMSARPSPDDDVLKSLSH